MKKERTSFSAKAAEMLTKPVGVRNIRISYRMLVIAAYSYMVLPIVLFLLGWLKPFIGIPLSAVLLFGLVWTVRRDYAEKTFFEMNSMALFLILAVTALWVFFSGVGYMWTQHPDWHWRNAMLRDLIDFSWPVIYPQSGAAFVYYFNYFLPAALFGKIFGWTAANGFLAAYTWLGICITILLICRFLKICRMKHIAVLLFVFVMWNGLSALRLPILNTLWCFTDTWYYFTSNDLLLQSVPNQAVFAWVAVSLFLNDRKISHYIFLGLCVLAAAPFPFIGLFVFLAADGILQIKETYRGQFRSWIKEVCSVQNICAAFAVLPVYAAFFVCNTATAGDSEGGFGLYVPIESWSPEELLTMLLFAVFTWMIYSAILFRSCRLDPLFWVTNLTMLLVPLFRLGTGNDFGMRVVIPAQLVQTVYVIRYLIYEQESGRSARYVLLAVLMAIAAMPTYNEYWERLSSKQLAQSKKEDYRKDGIYTYSNKSNEGNYCGGPLINFLYETPEDSLFFSKLCQKKSETEIRRDMEATEADLAYLGFALPGGEYRISPLSAPELYLTENGTTVGIGAADNILVTNSTVPGICELYFWETEKIWKFEGVQKEIAVTTESQEWGVPEIPPEYSFEIERAGNGSYRILWNGRYALTYEDATIFWSVKSEEPSQMWVFEDPQLL